MIDAPPSCLWWCSAHVYISWRKIGIDLPFHIYETERQCISKPLGKRIWIPGMLCTLWKSSKVEACRSCSWKWAEQETLWKWTGTISYWETSKRQGKKLLPPKNYSKFDCYSVNVFLIDHADIPRAKENRYVLDNIKQESDLLSFYECEF